MDFLFSVIIPVYNGEKFIAEAIRSALRQVDVNVEVIVIDDGSIDNTQKIVDGFHENIVFHLRANAGVSSARNFGASIAKGEFLAFLDADDVWAEDKLKIQKEKLLSGYDIVLYK